MSNPKRAAQAAKIVATPQNYKVCEGCESIVGESAAFCPNCNGYRFDSAADRVVAQAKLLATRDRTSVLLSDLD